MIIKQSVVDVLMFLFESYLEDDKINEAGHVMDKRDSIQAHLEEMGFHNQEINQAFDWLDDLADLQADKQHVSELKDSSTRIYSAEEHKLLDQESLGFINFLEQNDILTPMTRELILDSVVALGQPLDAEQLKWIILIVLHTNPAQENTLNLIENYMFDEVVDYIH